MNILIIEASYDLVTTEVHQARRALSVKRGVCGFGWDVTELYGPEATSARLFAAYQSGRQFGLVSGVGHGGPERFRGQNGDLLFGSGSQCNVCCAAAIVHLLSCNCAHSLGKTLVQQDGARAFIGYADFVLLPEDPALTEHFIAESVEIDIAVASGKSSAEARKVGEARYLSCWQIIWQSNAATPTDLAAFELNHAALVGPWTSVDYGAF